MSTATAIELELTEYKEVLGNLKTERGREVLRKMRDVNSNDLDSIVLPMEEEYTKRLDNNSNVLALRKNEGNLADNYLRFENYIRTNSKQLLGRYPELNDYAAGDQILIDNKMRSDMAKSFFHFYEAVRGNTRLENMIKGQMDKSKMSDEEIEIEVDRRWYQLAIAHFCVKPCKSNIEFDAVKIMSSILTSERLLELSDRYNTMYFIKEPQNETNGTTYSYSGRRLRHAREPVLVKG